MTPVEITQPYGQCSVSASMSTSPPRTAVAITAKGALTFAEYEAGLTEAGFVEAEITPTHEVTDGIHSAIVRARKPERVTGRRSASTGGDG